jgi:hypothetical protein
MEQLSMDFDVISDNFSLLPELDEIDFSLSIDSIPL